MARDPNVAALGVARSIVVGAPDEQEPRVPAY